MLHQLWHKACVVDVGMGEDQGGDGFGVIGKGPVIQFRHGSRTLKHAAIHQHPGCWCFNHVVGTCHGAGGAMKFEFDGHDAIPLVRRGCGAAIQPKPVRAYRQMKTTRGPWG